MRVRAVSSAEHRDRSTPVLDRAALQQAARMRFGPEAQPYPVAAALQVVERLVARAALTDPDDAYRRADDAAHQVLAALAPLGFTEVHAGQGRLAAVHPDAPSVLKVIAGDFARPWSEREDAIHRVLHDAAPLPERSHAPQTWWLSPDVALQERVHLDAARFAQLRPTIEAALAAFDITVFDLEAENVGFRIIDGVPTEHWVLLDGECAQCPAHGIYMP